MEKAFGAKLQERHRRGVVPSPTGVTESDSVAVCPAHIRMTAGQARMGTVATA